MKYYFITNPVSGSARLRHEFLRSVENSGLDYGVINTREQGDGTYWAEDICDKLAEDNGRARIFACGGDGTINEVVNGVLNKLNAGVVTSEQVEIGVIPIGTGNDFARNFGTGKDYLDVGSYARCDSTPCDLLKYHMTYDNKSRDGYCVNMFNIGLDCNIADDMSKYRKIPLVEGSAAYMMSAVANLISRRGANLHVKYEGGAEHEGPLMLISIANGCYCGGGIKGLPLALTDDGFMDVSLVKYISRRVFVKLFPMYVKGTHLESNIVKKKDVIKYTHEKSISIEAIGEPMKLCIDGEIEPCDRIEIEVAPGAFNLIKPNA